MSIGQKQIRVESTFSAQAQAVVFNGPCLDLLASMPDASVSLVVTSPPYNIGKSYEKRNSVAAYVDSQRDVIRECERVMKPNSSICWQVGNFVEDGAIIPIDYLLFPVFQEMGFRMRNRIVWHFEHGLHCSRRLSGRYEVIMWLTKGDDYFFDLDPIRIPQKYPGKKYFKGPKAGQYSCNPLGKNPGDLWVIPNVKSNHVEKTDHPCQFPVELVERLVLSLAPQGSWVLDPFLGAGTSVVAALRNGRRGVGAETVKEYVDIARTRVSQSLDGTLPVRPMHKPVFDPDDAGKALRTAPWLQTTKPEEDQLTLMEKTSPYLAEPKKGSTRKKTTK